MQGNGSTTTQRSSHFSYRSPRALKIVGLTSMLLAIGCGPEMHEPMAETPVQYLVRVVAQGVLQPVTLTMDYAGGSKQVTVTKDGASAFNILLDTGDSFSVAMDTDAPCALEDESGLITEVDPTVSLICEGVARLTELTLSGFMASDLKFTPDVHMYQADVSLLQASTTVTATTAHPEATVTVAGQTFVGGNESGPLELPLGALDIPIIVRHERSGLESTYQITVNRAAQVLQSVYAKASNTGHSDAFGEQIALSASGDTLAVGAYLEDGEAADVDIGDQDSNTVANSGAVYVFARIDGVWSQEAYIKVPSLETDDQLGCSVALSASGDILAVGAHLDDSGATGIDGDSSDNSVSNSGAVHIFFRTGSNWSRQAYIKASNTGSNDRFGRSLALSAQGNTLVVGASREDSGSTEINGNQDDESKEDSGAVYVFVRNNTVWTQQAYIKAANAQRLDRFGDSLALSASGNTLAVGATEEDSGSTGVDGDQSDDSATDSGAVYIFSRSGDVWTPEAYIKAFNTEAFDQFGISTALSATGDTLAVGAIGEDSGATGIDGDQADNLAANSGAVYVFTRNQGLWSPQSYIKASNTDASDHFGVSVALSASGDLLAVGADLESSNTTEIDGPQDNNLADESGAVYVFTRAEDMWSQRSYVKAANAEEDDRFGNNVALSGESMAISASFEDGSTTGVNGDQSDNERSASGAVYLFY